MLISRGRRNERTARRGSRADRGSRGPRGPKGETGATGPAGPSGGGGGSVAAVAVAFAARERWVRVLIADASVTPTSKVLATVQAPTSASDVVDLGWMYGVQVAALGTGSFEVVVFASALWTVESEDEYPGTTVRVLYVVG